MSRFAFAKKVLRFFGERPLLFANYYYLHLKNGRVPLLNLASPCRFGQKIIYLRLNHRVPRAKVCADKVGARQYVQERIGAQYLVPIHGIYDSFDAIAYKKIPAAFVLKPSHASGLIMICKDKEKFDWNNAAKVVNEWLCFDYYKEVLEYQYRGITPRILVEKYLESEDGQPVLDYKFYCFHGQPKFVQVDFDRFADHKRNFYDLNWTRLPFAMLYPPFKGKVDKPPNFSLMIELAEVLSREFLFVRVDLYNVRGAVYFGELTFHPEGGCAPIVPKSYDLAIGDMLNLDLRGGEF